MNNKAIVTAQAEPQTLHLNPTFFRPDDPVYCPKLCGGGVKKLRVIGQGYNQQLAIGDTVLYNNGALEENGIQEVWLASPDTKALLASLHRDILFEQPPLCGVNLLRKLISAEPQVPVLCRVATTYASYITFIVGFVPNGDGMDSIGNVYPYCVPINVDGSVRYE